MNCQFITFEGYNTTLLDTWTKKLLVTCSLLYNNKAIWQARNSLCAAKNYEFTFLAAHVYNFKFNL